MTPIEAAVEAALTLRRGGEDDLCIIVPAAVTAFLEAADEIGMANAISVSFAETYREQARAAIAALKELAQ